MCLPRCNVNKIFFFILYFTKTILNVSNGQGQKTNEIPLTFEIVEVNDTPRIRSPGVIDVVERDTGVQKWNITYTDPDDWKDFPSNYSISSPGKAKIDPFSFLL